MKNKILKSLPVFSLLILLSLCPCGTSTAQTTNSPPIQIPPLSLDFLTNLPTASSFESAKFGFSAGALLKSGGLENALKFDGYFHTNWMGSIEIQNSPSSTIVDALAAHFGYRWAWPSAEVYSQAGARRTWTTDVSGRPPNFQALGLVGASWLPRTGGRFLLGSEARILTSPTGSVLQTRPAGEFVGWMKLIF